LEHDEQGAKKLANTVLTAIVLLLTGVVVAGWAGMWIYGRFFAETDETRYMLGLISTMLPYTVMVCSVAILAGILNVHKHFAAPAAAPIVLNIFIISGVVIAGMVLKIDVKQQFFVVAVAVLLSGVAQIGLQVPFLRASGVYVKPGFNFNSAAFKRIMILMGPMIIGLTVTQINTLADTWIAKMFSASAEKGDAFSFFGQLVDYPLIDGAVSYLYYSQRLYQLPLGIFGISLATAIFPVISANAAKGDYESLAKNICRGVNGAIFIAVPAAVGLVLVARPLVSAIFERGEFDAADTSKTVVTLSFYAIGLCGFFAQQILTRAFFAMQDSRTPKNSAIAAVMVNIVLNLTLIWFIGTGGLALSTAICSYLQVIILVVVLRRRFEHSVLAGLGGTLLKTVGATVLMAVAGSFVMYGMRSLPAGGAALGYDIARVGSVVAVSVVIYYFASKMLKNESL
jgi:putative peptidoglycan lipid II flippase